MPQTRFALTCEISLLRALLFGSRLSARREGEKKKLAFFSLSRICNSRRDFRLIYNFSRFCPLSSCAALRRPRRSTSVASRLRARASAWSLAIAEWRARGGRCCLRSSQRRSSSLAAMRFSMSHGGRRRRSCAAWRPQSPAFRSSMAQIGASNLLAGSGAARASPPCKELAGLSSGQARICELFSGQFKKKRTAFARIAKLFLARDLKSPILVYKQPGKFVLSKQFLKHLFLAQNSAFLLLIRTKFFRKFLNAEKFFIGNLLSLLFVPQAVERGLELLQITCRRLATALARRFE